MKYSEAVRHLETLGLDAGPSAAMPARGRRTVAKRHSVPVVIAKNGAISEKLQRMIRQSRAEARKAL